VGGGSLRGVLGPSGRASRSAAVVRAATTREGDQWKAARNGSPTVPLKTVPTASRHEDNYPRRPPAWTGTLGTAARAVAGILAAAFLLVARPAHAMLPMRRAASAVAADPAAATAAAVATGNIGDAAGLVGATVALLVLLAFFSISETAITTLWPWKVREISDEEGPDSSFTLLRKDINRFLTTILIGKPFIANPSL